MSRADKDEAMSAVPPKSPIPTLQPETPRTAKAALAARGGASLVGRDPSEADVSVIPFAEGQRRQCLSLRREDGRVEIVTPDPLDASTRLWIESRIRAAGRPQVAFSTASADEIGAFYARLERELRALDQHDAELPEGAATEDDGDVITLSLAQISTDESPVVRFVNGTLYDALKASASDIHMETTPQGLVVRYRMDGVLQSITRLDGRDFADRAISRIKVMANLDISERRIPQDGRL